MTSTQESRLVASPDQISRSVGAARRRLGWSRRKAAQVCGVSYRFFWELEAGRNPGAQFDKVLAVTRRLGIRFLLLHVVEELAVAPPQPGRDPKRPKRRPGRPARAAAERGAPERRVLRNSGAGSRPRRR